MLDGQVGNAAARIEAIGPHDRLRGAGRYACFARSTMRARRCIERQRQVCEHLAEKEIRTGIARQKIRVLAYPAQPRVARQRFLEHRCTVHAYPIAESPDLLRHLFGKPRERFAHHLVIVPTERIARYIA